MTPGQILEIAAHVVTAALALWLGLTVATRSSSATARVFAGLAITFAAWSAFVLVERLSESAQATRAAHSLGELSSALAIAGVAHLSLLIASEGHPSRRAVTIAAAVYVAVVGLAL